MADIPASLDALRIPIDTALFHPNNARRHDDRGLEESLRFHGQYRPIVVQRSTGHVLAGNGTLAAARTLGWSDIAATFVDVDNVEALRILAVDNRLNDAAGYDDELLAELLGGLPDLAGTGYDTGALDELMARVGTMPDEHALEDDGPAPDSQAEPVTAPGDTWILGPHRVTCGDCREPGTVDAMLAGAVISVAFTSPPYADARKYDPDSGFTPIHPDDYVDWFESVQLAVGKNIAPDGSWFVNIKAQADGLDTPLYVLDLVIAHVRRWGWHFATEFCWERIGMPKSVTQRFKNQFEPVYQFTRGRWKMRPDDMRHATDAAITGVGVGGGDTSWGDDMSRRGFAVGRIGSGLAYPGNRLPPMSTASTGHTAAFPVGLPAWFIKAFSDPGDVVFDPFMGSGTTVIAAHQTGRVAYGVEISPRYCDVIARRYQLLTGDNPVLQSTGQPWDFLTDPPTADG